MGDNSRLSVAVITFNEAARIADCLKSVAFADEIVVVDSGSRDDTPAIARQHGAEVFHQPFLGFGAQKQAAVNRCRHDWVLLLDADEQLPQGSGEAVRKAIASADADTAAFEIQRKNFLHGRWIRHCGWWPDRLVRLVRKSRGRFSDDRVHERWQPDGQVARLPLAIEHRSFRNYAEMLEKLQHYSTLGAQEMVAQEKRCRAWQAIAHGGWTFLHDYGIKRGFLDGFDGFMIALLNAGGSFMKYAKCRELWIALQRCEEK